jgi:hypothetical protein
MWNKSSEKSMPPSGAPSAQPGAPAFLVELATRVETYLAQLIAAEEARWVEVNPTLAVPFSEMRGLVLAGGKRLRPAFCYWGSIATGADPSDERIVRTGAALELLHAFALFHDDIMDGSLTRRGVQTTHVRHSALHVEQALDGWERSVRQVSDLTQSWALRWDWITRSGPAYSRWLRPLALGVIGAVPAINRRIRIADRGLDVVMPRLRATLGVSGGGH